MKNELPCSPAQTGSLLRSDKLRGIKTKQCNVESNGELTLVRPGGLNTESELLDELVLK